MEEAENGSNACPTPTAECIEGQGAEKDGGRERMEEEPEFRVESVQYEVGGGNRRLGSGKKEAAREPTIERVGPEET